MPLLLNNMDFVGKQVKCSTQDNVDCASRNVLILFISPFWPSNMHFKYLATPQWAWDDVEGLLWPCLCPALLEVLQLFFYLRIELRVGVKAQILDEIFAVYKILAEFEFTRSHNEFFAGWWRSRKSPLSDLVSALERRVCNTEHVHKNLCAVSIHGIGIQSKSDSW